MKVYAQKQNQPQQQASPDFTRPGAKSLAAIHIPYLQRTMGNQTARRSLRVDAEGLEVGSDTSATTRFAHDFSRIPVHSKAPVRLQAKLEVNKPGDIYEQEANLVSEDVTSMPEPQLQRTCACDGGCPKYRNTPVADAHLQSKHNLANDSVETVALPIVHEALRSSGQPLGSTTRRFMESRFGHDFARVRVHTDVRAAESARAVNALAYTVGQDIYFGAQQYRPGTGKGDRLIAHELVHTIQQEPVRLGIKPKLEVSHPQDSAEIEADQLADRVVAPGGTAIQKPSKSKSGAGVINRQTTTAGSVSGLGSASAPVGRTIRVSGGQIMKVYGTFPSKVETYLADGWLSDLEMYDLWMSGKHTGCYTPGHDMMEMLTQRGLPCIQGGNIHGLSLTEILTWQGESGVGALGSLKLGDQLPNYNYIYMSPTRAYDVNKPLALAAGTSAHVFNMQRYLNEINAETTLAPDDKVALRRLQYLHYVMQYPDPTVRGIAGLLVPTPAQISRYKNLMKKSEPVLFLLDQLAVSMGLPN